MIATNLLFCVNFTYEKTTLGKPHAHPCYEIVYYVNGSGWVDFHKERHTFKKDTFMLVGPKVQHTEFDEKGTEVLYIGLEILGEDGYAEGIYSEADYGIKEYMRKIYHEVTNRTVYSEQLINSYCTIIAIKLISAARKRPLISADRNLDNILNYIDSNFCCEIDTAKLAEMSGYSYDHFRKIFAKKYNVGVNEYILQKRIELADRLLRGGNGKEYLIKEIAARCGFSSVAQFCTKYKEAMGDTPNGARA
ncbi:MAG TPA: hypothetical protein DCE65_02140, partial [Clostridiales bacterium]|nr:hypothetical protein [Clostridiales bacterium]